MVVVRLLSQRSLLCIRTGVVELHRRGAGEGIESRLGGQMTCQIRTFLGLGSGSCTRLPCCAFSRAADRADHPKRVASGEWDLGAGREGGGRGGEASSRISSGSPPGSIACNWNYRRTMGEIPASPGRLPLHQPQRSRRCENDSGRAAASERDREREREREKERERERGRRRDDVCQ